MTREEARVSLSSSAQHLAATVAQTVGARSALSVVVWALSAELDGVTAEDALAMALLCHDTRQVRRSTGPRSAVVDVPGDGPDLFVPGRPWDPVAVWFWSAGRGLPVGQVVELAPAAAREVEP